jgi:hypothetical protein
LSRRAFQVAGEFFDSPSMALFRKPWTIHSDPSSTSIRPMTEGLSPVLHWLRVQNPDKLLPHQIHSNLTGWQWSSHAKHRICPQRRNLTRRSGRNARRDCVAQEGAERLSHRPRNVEAPCSSVGIGIEKGAQVQPEGLARLDGGAIFKVHSIQCQGFVVSAQAARAVSRGLWAVGGRVWAIRVQLARWQVAAARNASGGDCGAEVNG